MGIDIYAYAEVRTDGKWESLYSATPLQLDPGMKVMYEMKQVYSERNYQLFERLTGEFHIYWDWVNACPTPLSTPQDDIPEDASEHMKLMWSTRWEADRPGQKCFNVLTLAELQTVDWGRYLMMNTRMGEMSESELLSYAIGEVQAWEDAMGLMGRLGAPDDVRMLFWFTP